MLLVFQCIIPYRPTLCSVCAAVTYMHCHTTLSRKKIELNPESQCVLFGLG